MTGVTDVVIRSYLPSKSVKQNMFLTHTTHTRTP